jgi:hypothetical protein
MTPRYSIIELTLLWTEEEAVLSEPMEHLPDDFVMTDKVRMRDEDVIKVDHDISRQDEVLEDVVHHCLEGGRGVGKAKVHHQQLKEPRLVWNTAFHSLPSRMLLKPHQTSSFEELGSLQTVNKVIDQGEWVPVLHSHGIEHLVVLDEPEPSVLLDEENQRHHRRLRWVDPAGVQPLCDEGVKLILFE